MRLWAVYTDMVMHEWARCTSHLRRKSGPAARRPRWSVHINRVNMLLSCEHALMQYKQTITNGRGWASHLRQLVAASYMHTTYTTNSMNGIWRLRLAMQRSHPYMNGRCGYRTYWQSSIYGKSSGISSMYGNSTPLVGTCMHTKHLICCLRDMSRNRGTEDVGGI